MSHTILFKILRNGDVVEYARFQNSHLGADLIWRNMGERWLGDKDYLHKSNTNDLFHTHYNDGYDSMKFWHLVYQKSIPMEERIMLASTYDYVVVKKKNISRLIKAFEYYVQSYENSGHISDQIEALKELSKKRIFGICWNQTSVSCDMWYEQWKFDEEGEVIEGTNRPYNIFKDIHHLNSGNKQHWFLFEKACIDHPPLDDLLPIK